MHRYLTIGLIAGSLLTSAAPAGAQFVQQGPKLVGAGSIGQAEVGVGVAISADGNTAIVGGPFDNNNLGAVWIFTRSGRTWSQQGSKLVGTGAAGGSVYSDVYFGWSVALSSDGNTALVGAWGDANESGAIYVFTRSGSAWTQQGPKLAPASCASCRVGWSVALSADGNTAVVGAIGGVGGVWVFTRTGSTWTQGPALVGTGGVGSTLQGSSVAVSADGNLMVVGGSWDNSNAGAVWTFARTGSMWAQLGEKLTSGEVNGHFGSSVALSADGSTAAVASPSDPLGLFKVGAIRIFTRSGSTWTQQGAKLVGTDGVGQATAVSLSGDGNRVLDGGAEDFGVLSPFVLRGTSWMFARSGSIWSQIGHKLLGRDTCCTTSVQEGASVALSSDGRTAIVGANAEGGNVGAAWIYTMDSDLVRSSDSDGDWRSDITVYNAASGVWSSLTSASGYTGATNRGWGGNDYTPVPGDYDGDGKADLGLYQQSSGNWYVLLSGANFTTTLVKSAGGPGWLPVPGDYDGDGKTDPAVYNTVTGQWYGLQSASNYTTSVSITYGGTGYQATPGDFDGDGRTDIGVYNTSIGMWSVLLSRSDYTTALVGAAGGPGYEPVQADYDGDGRADLAVYNATTGLWYALKSSTNFTTALSVSWGGPGYTPVKGDYDGDSKADLAVYVEATGAWYILLSGANYTTAVSRNWGGVGYAPLPQSP